MWLFIKSTPVNVNVAYIFPSTSSILVVEFKYFLAIDFPVALSDNTSFFTVYNLPFTVVFSVIVSFELPLFELLFPPVFKFPLFELPLFESGIVGSSFELMNLTLVLSKATPKLTVWFIALTNIPIVICASKFGTSTVNSTVSLSITFLVNFTVLLFTFTFMSPIKLYEENLNVM